MPDMCMEILASLFVQVSLLFARKVFWGENIYTGTDLANVHLLILKVSVFVAISQINQVDTTFSPALFYLNSLLSHLCFFIYFSTFWINKITDQNCKIKTRFGDQNAFSRAPFSHLLCFGSVLWLILYVHPSVCLFVSLLLEQKRWKLRNFLDLSLWKTSDYISLQNEEKKKWISLTNEVAIFGKVTFIEK